MCDARDHRTIPSFERLHKHVGDAATLATAYGLFVRAVCSTPLWDRGPVEGRRILWTQARDARVADPGAFRARGLYIWGIDERPVYIGKTLRTFNGRFGRYIWEKRSQCTLAREFEAPLRRDGLKGFPREILDWYAKRLGTGTARLRGAVRFAEEGIDRVWFTLLPHRVAEEISVLEEALIRVGQDWNRARAFRQLLNVTFCG